MIAACLITKNSEQVLERTLAAIRPHVDGIFVYDTGSTDGTLEQLERLGRCDKEIEVVEDIESGETTSRTEIPLAPITVASGVDVPLFEDGGLADFAWARQRSFEMPGPEYDWMIWLDDDDEVQGAHNLRTIALTAPEQIDGFLVLYDYARDDHGHCICQLWRERLIRRSAGLEWRNPVHEVLVTPDGRPPVFAPLPAEQVRYVHHRPPDRYPGDRNLRILRAHAKATEDAGEQIDPRTLAYLGTETMTTGDYGTAAAYLDRYLQHPHATWSDERMQVHHKLGICLRAMGNPLAGIEAEWRALRERDDWAETSVGLMEGFAQVGDWARAERWARRALEQGMPPSMLILNPLEFTLLPLARLSEACLQTGRYAEARDWHAKAQEAFPGNPLVAERGMAVHRACYEGELTQALLTVHAALAQLDENEKALRLLEECVPYPIDERPEVVHARAAQRHACRHLVDPDRYRAYYEREDTLTSTVSDEVAVRAGEAFHRVGLLEQGLAEQASELGRTPRVLDLGCNDAWLSVYLHEQGIRCDGVELNRRAVDAAHERLNRLGIRVRDVRVWQGDLHDAPRLVGDRRYDAVVLFEVLEHVPDVERTLRVCERLLEPDGRVYVSTPDGAYDPGSGLAQQTRQHVRAWPVQELVGRLNARGQITNMDVGQGLTVAGYRPGRKRGKVVFFGGQCPETWHPAQLRSQGMGGSETALANVASHLARVGFEVVVYAEVDPTLTAPGVLWRRLSAWDPSEECDAMIVSRTPACFDHEIRAPVRALWCHDQAYSDVTAERAARMTHVVVLSEWQRSWAERIYPSVDPSKFLVLRNGVPGWPETVPGFEAREPVVAYSSAPDRGLAVLLELWPRIRERVPDARLEVFYGWDVFDRVAMFNPPLVAYKQMILHRIDELGGEEGGIVWRGRVGQDELHASFQRARVLGYPASFRETSCITAMEARVAGLPIVTSRLAALTNTVGRHGILIPIPGDDDSPGLNANEEAVASGEYGERFVDAVCRMLSDEEFFRVWQEKGRAGSEGLTWARRTSGWKRLVLSGRRSRGRGGSRKRAAVAV